MINHEKEIKFANKIKNLLEKSPTVFHVIENNINLLKDKGFKQINENEKWNLKPGGKYFLTKNNVSLCAFTIPQDINPKGYMITASHSDFPCFSLQKNSNTNTGNYYVVSLQQYGSIMQYSYIDVPLSIAGKLILETENGIKTQLVNIDKPCLVIPNISSHLSKENKGLPLYNLVTQLRPIFSLNKSSNIMKYVAQYNNLDYNKIIDSVLYVYRWTRPFIWGENDEFLSSKALDNQLSVYTLIYGLIESKPTNNINVCFIFNNEEVKSQTRTGADSIFPISILKRISHQLQLSYEEEEILIANSFALSVDNSQGLHPNFQNKYNNDYSISLGEGIAIKKDTGKSYATISEGSALVKKIAEKSKIKFKEYKNHPDLKGGSSLGKYFESLTSILTTDIGIPQLSMHSSLETCSTYDILHMKEFIKTFYSSSIVVVNNSQYIIE